MRFVTARKEGLARYRLKRTHKWLGWLAQQMRLHNEPNFLLETLQPDWLPMRQRILYHGSCGLLFGLLGALIFGLLFGGGGALLGGLFSALLGALDRKIKTIEVFIWSWKRTRSWLMGSLLIGLAGGLLGALIYAVLIGLSAEPPLWLLYGIAIGLPEGLPAGLLIGLLGGLLSSVIYGFSRVRLSESCTTCMYEEMRRLVVNALAGALLGCLLSSLLVEFINILTGKTVLVLFSALVGALSSALIFGLDVVIQHLLLRLWLWQSNCFPWCVQRFLGEASDHLFLQRVGRGYRFMHRRLFDYFANLDKSETTATGLLTATSEEV